MTKKLNILILPSHNNISNSEIKTSKELSKHNITFGNYQKIIIQTTSSKVKITFNQIDLKTFDFVWLSSS